MFIKFQISIAFKVLHKVIPEPYDDDDDVNLML